MPATCNNGKCIISIMCYTCANWTSLFVYVLLGVNVNVSTSTIDLGVQCDIIPLPLMTSTPTQSIDSHEGEDSTLPQDHGEDNLSQPWVTSQRSLEKLTAVGLQRMMWSNIVPCKPSCFILMHVYTLNWVVTACVVSLNQNCTTCYRHDYTLTSGTMKETKFLVFFSSLMELLAACSKCLSPCTLSTMVIGTFLSVKQHCTSCGHLRTWNSQPCIGNGALPVGNLLLSASILYAGVLEFLSVPTITQKKFLDISPTISCHQCQGCGKRREQHSLQ